MESKNRHFQKKRNGILRNDVNGGLLTYLFPQIPSNFASQFYYLRSGKLRKRIWKTFARNWKNFR